MTAVLSFPQVRSLAASMLALVIACSLLSFAAPRAQASSPVSTSALTDAQVSAIISLLSSFGADQSTINNVRAALGGGAVTPPVISGAPTCSLRADPSAVAPGMSTVLTWSSTNATSATWTNDASGKDNIAPPAGTPATNGSASFVPMKTLPVGMTSLPSVTLKVTGPYGSATCVAYISVVSSQQTESDSGGTVQVPERSTQSKIVIEGTPTSGPAPLTVLFRTEALSTFGVPSINFGDGKNEQMIAANKNCVNASTNGACMLSYYSIHTYKNAGIYKVSGGIAPGCPIDPSVGACSMVMMLLDGPTITVGSIGTTSPAKATYQAFIDGNLFITTKDITRADALANCKQNVAANPGRTFRCVWGGEEIYSGTSAASTASLSAAPTNGAAPLIVTFSGNGVGKTAFGGIRLEFGDGSAEVVCGASGRACYSFTTSHKYVYGGNYTARLISVGEGTNVTIAQTNISVANTTVSPPCTTGSSSCPTAPPIAAASLSASPASGVAPLAVTFAGNGGGRTAFGGARIDFGDGSAALACDPGRSCGAITLAHTYTVAGKYIARLIMTGEGSLITLAQTNVTVVNPTSTTSARVPSSAGAFRTDGPIAFMAAAAAVPFTLAVDMLSSIFYWTGFY